MGGTNLSDGGINNGGTVNIFLTNDAGDAIFARCTTANIPSSKAGYAVGCQIVASDTGIAYFNFGTRTSSSFKTAIGSTSYEVVANTSGTSNVNVFGATNGFAGTVTAVTVVALDGTNASITLANTAGSVVVIAKGSTAGAVTGGTTLTNTGFTTTGTMIVTSSISAGGAARVVVEYTIP
jgi:hypothetical protein